MQFTGGNILKPRDGRLKEPEVPDDFIDQNLYFYRLVNGQMHLKGIKLGVGWENRPFSYEDLSCFKENINAKGDEEMSTTAINWTELDSKLLELYKKGLTFKQISEAIGVSTSATHKRFHKLKKMQAKEPATEPTAKLETVEEENQPAEESIADSLTNDEPIPYVVNSLDFEKEQTPENILTDLIVNRSRDKVADILGDPIATAIIKELVRQDVI